MLHSKIIPEHGCDGELVELEDRKQTLQYFVCSSCAAEFTFEPDFNWVSIVYCGVKTPLQDEEAQDVN
jgi:hypothetical protein